MASNGTASTVGRGLVWVVRIASLISILLIWAPFLAAIPSRGVAMFLGLVLSSPLWLPYLYILWHVRRKIEKRALAMAVGVSPVIVLIALLLGSSVAENVGGFSWLRVALGLFAAVQALLVLSSVGTYYTMRREAGDRQTLLRSFGIGAVYILILLIIAVLLPGLVRSRKPANEASAGASMRQIITAQITYAIIYPEKGFAARLAELGPPPPGNEPSEKAANQIDPQLASGVKSEYRFVLRPRPPAAAGIVRTFTISARPIEYGVTGVRSFFTDESGVIRSTSEDRPATVDDPPL